MDAALARSVEALPDYRELAHFKLAQMRAGQITAKEYMPFVGRYKALRNALYHAGYLPDDWKDGEV